MAAPTMADSEIGVSITRRSPKRSSKPCGDLERAAVDADVFADQEDVRVALHLFPEALADGFQVGGQACYPLAPSS